MEMTVAEAVLRVVKEQGTDVIQGYPGAANTPVYDKINNAELHCVLTRNEQGAAHAASSYFKMTGKVGVCTATSGPGATNLITGIANAYMDSTPLIAITGQVPLCNIGKDAFQEVDTTGVTTPITKHNYLVKNAEDSVSIMREAFYIAKTGRPGPVVVDIPLDIQKELIEFTPCEQPEIRGYNPEPELNVKQIKKLAKMLRSAKRPFVVLGGGVLGAGASNEFTAFAEKIKIPVASTLMGISGINSDHSQYLGMLGLHGTHSANSAFLNSDLIIFMGSRISDRAVYDSESTARRAKIVHIDIDPAEINKNIICDLSIVADIKNLLIKLNEYIDFVCPDSWLNECIKTKSQNIKSEDSQTKLVNPKLFLKMLSDKTTPETVVATEVGQNQIWTANHYKFSKPNTFLTSGGFGTMGYGLPAALGAKIARPELTVIAIEGDGSFQMAMPELAAMRQSGSDLKIVIFKNRSLGMVHELQKLHFDSNFVSVDLGDYPHLDKIAEAYDIPYMQIRTNDEIENGIKALLKDGQAFILEVLVDEFESTL